MKLRTQLIVVSLFALCLPWAGARFIYEMETVLRSGQLATLAAVAESVALLTEGRPGLLQPLVLNAVPEAAGQRVYFRTAAAMPAVDGYPESDGDVRWHPTPFVEANRPAEPLRARFLGITAAGEAYSFIGVDDPDIRYHNPATGGLASGDHIILAFGGGRAVRRYWLAPEAPGPFVAKFSRQGTVVTEPRIRGVWRDTATGYQVEVRMPLELLGERFGFAVVDGENRSRWVGSMAPDGQPGRLIRPEPAMTELLAAFGRDNLRYSLLDKQGWVLASSGGLSYRPPEGDALPAGAWMLEFLYRRVMFGTEDSAAYGPQDPLRIERTEVDRALRGERASGWYGVAGERGVAIASVALPVRVDNRVIGVLLAEQSSSEILSLTNGAVIRLLLLTLIATLLIGGGLLAYASFLSLRIRRLGRSVAGALGEDGQLTGEFPQHFASDEIGDLGRHFGQLLGRMKEYNDYLRTLASKLSHELRTPLAVVSSSLDNLHHESLSGSGAEYIERARGGAERLRQILTAMSEASRVEESIRSAELAPLDLNALLVSHVKAYRAAFGRDIECSVPEECLEITGSADLLAQMLDKLMDNAADFCPADGRIRFALECDRRSAVLRVENDGPGLPERMRGEIFASMVSVRAGQGQAPHLGLGLTIVRLIVEFHGGTVWAENCAGGVCFVVVLPLKQNRG